LGIEDKDVSKVDTGAEEKKYKIGGGDAAPESAPAKPSGTARKKAPKKG
jgi:hypothetical protein